MQAGRMQSLIQFLFTNLNYEVKATACPNLSSAVYEELREEAVLVRRRVAAGLSQICSDGAPVIVQSSFYSDFVMKVAIPLLR